MLSGVEGGQFQAVHLNKQTSVTSITRENDFKRTHQCDQPSDLLRSSAPPSTRTMFLLPSRLSEGLQRTTRCLNAHLKSTVEVGHLLGVLPLRHSDALLHLFSLRLDFFPKCNETVNCSLKRADKWFWIKCCIKTVSLR